MNASDADGSVLAWVIPPSLDPGSADPGGSPDTQVRLLADELEAACGPEKVSVEVVPGGISHIHLRFADREAAFDAFDAAQSQVRSYPEIVCRVVATTRGAAG